MVKWIKQLASWLSRFSVTLVKLPHYLEDEWPSQRKLPVVGRGQWPVKADALLVAIFCELALGMLIRWVEESWDCLLGYSSVIGLHVCSYNYPFPGLSIQVPTQVSFNLIIILLFNFQGKLSH